MIKVIKNMQSKEIKEIIKINIKHENDEKGKNEERGKEKKKKS